ncbi:MAG: hypothetical protein O3B73_18895 [bacterium]|jgi:hypothetical protein|nr:hypothetical protein [bacterium]
MSLKSPTCSGSQSGKPLSEYDSEEEAREAADYARKTYGRTLDPYLCDRCDRWHLGLENRKTPSLPCPTCTGTDGRLKEAYQSREDAQKRADILGREQGVALSVYPCDHGNGWHLTRGPASGKKKRGARRK